MPRTVTRWTGWPGRLDLRAQPADVDVDRPRVAVVVGAPDPVEELAPRVRPAGVAGEHREQAELLRPEVDRLAVATELVGDEVELEVVAERDPVVEWLPARESSSSSARRPRNSCRDP